MVHDCFFANPISLAGMVIRTDDSAGKGEEGKIFSFPASIHWLQQHQLHKQTELEQKGRDLPSTPQVCQCVTSCLLKDDFIEGKCNLKQDNMAQN